MSSSIKYFNYAHNFSVLPLLMSTYCCIYFLEVQFNNFPLFLIFILNTSKNRWSYHVSNYTLLILENYLHYLIKMLHCNWWIELYIQILHHKWNMISFFNVNLIMSRDNMWWCVCLVDSEIYFTANHGTAAETWEIHV